MTDSRADDDPSPNPPEARQRLRLETWLPWLVFVFSLTLVCLYWLHEERDAESLVQRDFDSHAHEAMRQIEQRIVSYEQVLRNIEGLFLASVSVEREEFDTYVSNLHLQQTHPGVMGIAFSRIVTREQKEQFTADMRKQGLPRYAVMPPGDRPVYAPVAYAVTFSKGSLPPFGFDLYSDPVRRAAMIEALDRGKAAVSGKTALLNDQTGRRPGVVMYLPVSKSVPMAGAGMTGWIAMPIDIKSMMAIDAEHQDGIGLDVEVYDGIDMAPSSLLYDSNQVTWFADAPKSHFRVVKHLPVADRVWTLAIRSMPSFDARLEEARPGKLWLATGAGCSVLLALVIWLLTSSRARAVAAARDINRELHEREEHYRRLFENSATIAFILDPSNGRIVDANIAAEAFWGYPLERLRRLKIDHIDVAARDGIHALMSQVTKGVVSRFESRHRLANGELRDVELHAGSLEHRNKILIYSLVHDITTRKRAEQALRASEERYRVIAENTSDVIWMMDAQSLRFTYISPSVERQRGYSPDEIMELQVKQGNDVPPQFAKALQMAEHRLRERVRAFRAGNESRRREVRETDLPHKDGRMIPIEVVSTLLCDENDVPHSIVGVSRDISARRQAQEEQKRFVYMVSHEFRTPLATIDGAIQRLQATTAVADPATSRRFTKIQSAVDRLTTLLDDFLSQERIDTVSDGLRLCKVSPLALLYDSEASAKALSTSHRITIDASGAPDNFACDIDRMRLTLRVLADNAVKYTPPGAHIRLYARTPQQGGLEFIVEDNGDGIPEHELPQLFDRFFRGQRASLQSGSGLGLFMARSMVEMHGGTLTACNLPGAGAQFTIWLPEADLEP